MSRIYSQGIGKPRQQLHRQVHTLFSDEDDCPVRRIDAFCKILDDASSFAKDRKGRARLLRQKVMRLAARYHPLVERPETIFEKSIEDVHEEIANQIGIEWKEINEQLFADILEFRALLEFDEFPSPREILTRYNVGQIQVALYDAVSITVEVSDNYRAILTQSKLAGLLHTIRMTTAGSFLIELNGPTSILHETKRYGVAFARLLPTLLGCDKFRMRANILRPKSNYSGFLEVSSEDQLSSYRPRGNEHDSTYERKFEDAWLATDTNGWKLVREGSFLHKQQTVFVPDFILKHSDGREVFLEIVGFWTPEYLEHKLAVLDTFSDAPIIVAVEESLRLPRSDQGFVTFRKKLSPELILDKLTEYE